MADVFVSHARMDGPDGADFVQWALEDQGWSVFRDREGILGGDRFLGKSVRAAKGFDGSAKFAVQPD